MAFKPIIPPSSTPRRERYSTSHQINALLSNNFHSTTVLLFGAILQGALILAIPRIWVLLPSILILIARFADTMAVTYHLRPNPYLQDSILQHWTTIIPDAEGNLSDTPADEKVAVLLLAAKANHPLGVFAPNFGGVGTRAKAMYQELGNNRLAYGYLGETGYTTKDSRGAQEVMNVSYWRSIDDIHNYAASPRHVEAMEWWSSVAKNDPENLKHVGIAHEIFEAPKSKWETVSLNFQPTRLGATSYFRKGDKLIGGIVDDQWISPIVEARGRLAKSNGRLNWTSHSHGDAGNLAEKMGSY